MLPTTCPGRKGLIDFAVGCLPTSATSPWLATWSPCAACRAELAVAGQLRGR